MPFNENLPFSETTWRNDADARERAQNSWNRRDMGDWQEADFRIMDRERNQAHKEAAEATRMAVARCDGSGIIEEYYIDVDQTNVIACPGCFACELVMAAVADLPGDNSSMPDWMEPELVEFRGTRKPVGSEVRPAIQKEVA